LIGYGAQIDGATIEPGAIVGNLAARGLGDYVKIDYQVIRGLAYYTGIVFEAADTKNPRLGSLFGGGRYDALPKIFGRPDLSATGAAGGIERIAMSLGEAAGAAPPLVYVAAVGAASMSYALKVERAARDAGISCEAALGAKALSKQLEDASRIGAGWAFVVGEKEEKAGSVTLKDMKSGREQLVPLAEALKRVAGA
jgi:histidyl-tRNA synthetase